MEIFQEAEETEGIETTLYLWVACHGDKFDELCNIVEDSSLEIAKREKKDKEEYGNKEAKYNGRINHTVYRIFIGFGGLPSADRLHPHIINVARTNKDNDELAIKMREAALKYKQEAEEHIKEF